MSPHRTDRKPVCGQRPPPFSGSSVGLLTGMARSSPQALRVQIGYCMQTCPHARPRRSRTRHRRSGPAAPTASCASPLPGVWLLASSAAPDLPAVPRPRHPLRAGVRSGDRMVLHDQPLPVAAGDASRRTCSPRSSSTSRPGLRLLTNIVECDETSRIGMPVRSASSAPATPASRCSGRSNGSRRTAVISGIGIRDVGRRLHVDPWPAHGRRRAGGHRRRRPHVDDIDGVSDLSRRVRGRRSASPAPASTTCASMLGLDFGGTPAGERSRASSGRSSTR